MRFAGKEHLIPLTAQGESATSSLDLDSFKMTQYEVATICILFAASLTGDNVLTVNGGASAGTKTAAATFTYALTSAAPKNATADVLAADSTSSSLTLTAATYQGKVLVIQVDAQDMNISNTTYDWVTVNLDGTASTATVTAWAILTEPRYADDVSATQIT